MANKALTEEERKRHQEAAKQTNNGAGNIDGDAWGFQSPETGGGTSTAGENKTTSGTVANATTGETKTVTGNAATSSSAGSTGSEGKVSLAYDPASDAAYQQALAALQAASSNAPVFANTYQGQLQDLYDQIVNRKPFQYDINSDMLYNQYVQQYQQSGKLAMADTMGQAAALTGGYGSTYGQAVGQQQYDAYLQNLNDVIPELYGMAYDRYNDEGNRLIQQYGLLGDMADNEYGRYQDAVNLWLNERAYAQDQLDQAYDRGYNNWQNDYSIAENRAAMLAQSGDFSGWAQIYGDDTAASMQNGWIASNPELAYRNGLITPDQYFAMTGAYPPGYTAPKSGGSGGRYNAETAALQKQLNDMGANLSVDGVMGPKTRDAIEEYMGDTGSKTRGQIARDATNALINGEITNTEYQTVLRSLT